MKLGSGLFLLVYDPKKQKNAILAYLQKMQETPDLRSLGAPLYGTSQMVKPSSSLNVLNLENLLVNFF